MSDTRQSQRRQKLISEGRIARTLGEGRLQTLFFKDRPATGPGKERAD